MAKNKYDFIANLLNSNNFDINQKERFIALAIEVLKNPEIGEEKLWKEINALKELVQTKVTNTNKDAVSFNSYVLIGNRENTANESSRLKHEPQIVNALLLKFKENTVFKWTTHPWDERKYLTIEDFIEELNENKKHLSKIFNCNRDLYSLINYFLFNPGTSLDENRVPVFGWKNINDIKIGWQYPDNLLIDWCKENFNHDKGKKPFQFEIPIQFKPKKLVKGKKIQTFENIVDVFKTEIQFRDNYLSKELFKRQKGLADFNFVGLEKLDKLDFYSYTSGILSAIDTILEQIRMNETEKNVIFEVNQGQGYFSLSITHQNSFPTKRLNKNNPQTFLGGQLNDIAKNLFSLCDYSIISNFEDENRVPFFGELKILFSGVEAEIFGKSFNIISSPKLKCISERQSGFTHNLKFYL